MKDFDFKFRTVFEVEKAAFSISLKDRIFLAGSCFADVIAGNLAQRKFDVLANPFGNIFNPYSLLKLLIGSLEGGEVKECTFIENNGRFINYDFHSEISAASKAELTLNIKRIRKQVSEFLTNSDCIVLTYGTSFVYRLIENDEIVANCHKVPSKRFTKHLLSPKDVIDGFEDFYKKITNINPDVKIILTVSPVRHIKDSIPLNNLSKSILRTGIHYICESFPSAHYFPSYEILMDDLRDYRFYKEDLIHPTEFAEKYVWSKFSNAYLDNEAIEFIKAFDKLKKSIEHRPFNRQSKEHQKFLRENLTSAEEMNKKVDMSEEISFLKNQLLD